VAAWFVAAMSGGCYPALKVVQPKAQFTLVDSTGAPIEDAKIMLTTYRQPFGALHPSVATFRTDARGTVALKSERKWHMQVVLPDGITWYTWAYCIEKSGYLAVASQQPNFKEPVGLTLERSDQQSVCRPPDDSDWAPRVETR